MGEVDKNEKWTTWKEVVENFVIKENCPPYHFAKNVTKCYRSKCRKCCIEYIEENREIFDASEGVTK